MDTKLLEIEDGNGFNESVTYATRSAIEVAVLELIYQGHDRGYWEIDGEHRHPHMNDGTNDRHQIKEKNESSSRFIIDLYYTLACSYVCRQRDIY